MITSSSNNAVRRIIQLNTKAKTRREEGCFVLEGMNLFREIPPELLESIFVSESFSGRFQMEQYISTWLAAGRRPNVQTVSDTVFRKICDTKTPQGILAIARIPRWTREDLLGRPGAGRGGTASPLIVVAERLQDPGNIGTIIRTAEAAGATGIAVSSDTADLFSPKVSRATMGSLFRVPVITEPDLPELISWLAQKGVRTCAAHLKGSSSYTDVSFAGGTAFLIGNEGSGLSDEIAEAAEIRVRIPMEGKIESLNAAVAASLLLYEAHRQRNPR